MLQLGTDHLQFSPLPPGSPATIPWSVLEHLMFSEIIEGLIALSIANLLNDKCVI